MLTYRLHAIIIENVDDEYILDAENVDGKYIIDAKNVEEYFEIQNVHNEYNSVLKMLMQKILHGFERLMGWILC